MSFKCRNLTFTTYSLCSGNASVSRLCKKKLRKPKQYPLFVQSQFVTFVKQRHWDTGCLSWRKA
ncbi:Uncharacterized protein dnm_083600 [Desulfonema magnum]|uniref:Uncharacterized protein n=1 Tax=Desulfonema magnum TaxID=45655 RepID=A0A975BVY5_9BACT|nr:Uncharacterized protein dnm_083600 [Desulfonema magnum]